MQTPTVTVKPAGTAWCLHITYPDHTTHVPAYYPTEAWASYVAGYLRGRYDTTCATGRTEQQVRETLLAVHTLGGQLQPVTPPLVCPECGSTACECAACAVQLEARP